MTALTTEARLMLVNALNAANLKTYATIPATPKAGQIVVMPDQPWIRIERIGSPLNYEVRLKALLLLDARSNEAAQTEAENTLDAYLAAVPVQFQVTYVGPPTITDLGAQGSMVTVEISQSVHMRQ